MQPKLLLLIIALAVVLVTAYITLAVNSSFPKLSKDERETAINQAKYFYQQKRGRGDDMSNGPCLSDALMPGWVADIAHNPRQAIDDLPQNQCTSYREGRAHHFVELDLDGNLIRAE